MSKIKPTEGDSKAYWLDRSKNILLLIWLLIVACALVAGADLFYVKHTHFDMEHIFDFYGLYGFVSFVFIVYAGKFLRKIVMRDEDYYER